MTKAIELIVNDYVRLGDRAAVEGLVAHHQLLLEAVEAQPRVVGVDLVTPTKSLLEEEIGIIRAGLKKLAAP